MKVFALSDVHVDYPENARWIERLSNVDYTRDTLILAGDISDKIPRVARCFEQLVKKFCYVFFVPGNHDLWVKKREQKTSIDKFYEVQALALSSGVKIRPETIADTLFVPLLSWYDFSFGQPNDFIKKAWMDFGRCVWPASMDHVADVTAFFHDENTKNLQGLDAVIKCQRPNKIVSFSHFLPRIDVMPDAIPLHRRDIYPVLGNQTLDAQVRAVAADIHIYGHSHINRNVTIDGVCYLNNAYAYPTEEHLSRKALLDVFAAMESSRSIASSPK